MLHTHRYVTMRELLKYTESRTLNLKKLRLVWSNKKEMTKFSDCSCTVCLPKAKQVEKREKFDVLSPKNVNASKLIFPPSV